jgi:hypothetical protein
LLLGNLGDSPEKNTEAVRCIPFGADMGPNLPGGFDFVETALEITMFLENFLERLPGVSYGIGVPEVLFRGKVFLDSRISLPYSTPVAEIPGFQLFYGYPVSYLPCLAARSRPGDEIRTLSGVFQLSLEYQAIFIVAVDYNYDAPVRRQPFGISF